MIDCGRFTCTKTAYGVSGYEAEVRSIVQRLLEPLGMVQRDRVGSVLCSQGDAGPRVMIAGHMDEIGFMVHHITNEGQLKFHPLGGWWDQSRSHEVSCIVQAARRRAAAGVSSAK